MQLKSMRRGFLNINLKQPYDTDACDTHDRSLRTTTTIEAHVCYLLILVSFCISDASVYTEVSETFSEIFTTRTKWMNLFC